MADAIRTVSGLTYRNIRSTELYITTGSAGDWFYGLDATEGNNGYRAAAYTYELRPVGANPGFELPPSQIIPTGREVYASFRAYLRDVLNDPIEYPVDQ